MSDLASAFRKAVAGKTDIEIVDVDSERDSSMDLSDAAVQERFIAEVAAGDYDIIVASPPCGSWSRSHYNGRPGPRPVRSNSHPWAPIGTMARPTTAWWI